MTKLLIEGLTPEEHRAVYPMRWRCVARNWSIFWWSLPIIPIFIALNWLFGNEWDKGDSNLCLGYIIAHLLFAFDPARTGLRVNWYLDKPTLWQRLRDWRAA